MTYMMLMRDRDGNPFKATPSEMQSGFFQWIDKGHGSAVLIAVAGSGKSTTIVQALPLIPEGRSVHVLAFNATIAKEMRNKITDLGAMTRRAFRSVRATTFHSVGFGSLCKHLKVSPQDVQTDGGKLKKLFKRMAANDELVRLYGSYVPKLVSYAKGEGINALVRDTDEAWWNLIHHHDLSLEDEEATEGEAVQLARRLLEESNRVARDERWIDFDDQLYLPVLWRTWFWQNEWVFVDECQDTNPIRRAIAKRMLRPGGRLVAVGDPNQAIYGFTGASHDAIDLIKREFRAIELPLTVSYRCPKVAEALVHEHVPHFKVHDSAPEGWQGEMPIKKALAEINDHDAILCRQTAPLLALAFTLIAQGRGCTVLGRDIAAGLVSLIEKQRAKGVDNLIEKLEAYRDTACADFMAKGEEEKADALNDKVDCILTVASNTFGPERTVPKLCAKIEGMFTDDAGTGLLTLCTMHKAKGKEWKRVGILRFDLCPSKYARQEHQYQQELNLMYVAQTRFQERLYFLQGDHEDLRAKR